MKDGTPIEMTEEDGKLLLPRQHIADPELAKLIAKIVPKNRHTETDWGVPVGRETW